MPDESTILQFRNLLERHGLTEQIFQAINLTLSERVLFLKAGTIVDASLIAASTIEPAWCIRSKSPPGT
ncbi:hypothetical protein ACH5Y9_01130 [Methylomonas sp. BW4-1]|uniref:hypothetical protein n=1 Tax=Methylomonas sp. BW4-1 TaxID=3376685 RepID=UPI004040FEE9